MREVLADNTTKIVDQHVGQRLRMLRIMNGLSQKQLAQSLELTFQQVQKYEKGVNRLAASRIFECSVLFGVEPNFFFEGVVPQMATKRAVGFKVTREIDDNSLQSDRNLKLLAAYQNVADTDVQERILALVRAIAHQRAASDTLMQEP